MDNKKFWENYHMNMKAEIARKRAALDYINGFTPSVATPASQVRMPESLRAKLAFAREQHKTAVKPTPQVGEIWRVAPNLLMWIEDVSSGVLSGYLVHDRPEFAGPDDLIIDELDSPTGEPLAVCMWRKVAVTQTAALGRLGKSAISHNVHAFKSLHSDAKVVGQEPDGNQVFEIEYENEEDGRSEVWYRYVTGPSVRDMAAQVVYHYWDNRSQSIKI